MKEGQTILEVLESFLKVELEDIRRYFGAEVPVHSRKRELVDRLAGYIVTKPEEWLGKMNLDIIGLGIHWSHSAQNDGA